MAIRMIAAALALSAALPVHAAERNYLVGSFDTLIVEGDIQVTLDTSKAPSGKASGSKLRLGSLNVDRQGTVVRVRFDTLSATRTATESVQLAMTGRSVTKIIVQGNGRVRVNALNGEKLHTEIHGNGSIDVGSVNGDNLVAILGGNGRLTLGTGAVRNGDVVIDGAPVVTATGIKMTTLRLDQNGPAATAFTVSDSAEITNSGAGTINIEGNANCFVRQAGSASINCAKAAGK